MQFPLKSTFLALPLEDQAQWQFQALQEKLKEFEDCLRFQSPQTPHVTLQYWKEVMEIEYQPIIEQAEKITLKTDPFTIKVAAAETFGSRHEDRVLVLSMAFSEELACLRKSCPWPLDREFKPHITLARMRHPQRFARVKKQVMKKLHGCAFEVSVDRLRLYAEVDGVKQTHLEDFVFMRTQ